MSHARVIVAIPEDRAGDIQSAVEWEMMPFDENGELFRDGSRWDWYVIGGRFSGCFHGKDIIQVKDINLVRMMEERRERLLSTYRQAESDAMCGEHKEFIYGVDPSKTTVDEYLGSKLDGVQFAASYAFLQGRRWHEGERMGWFGSSALTECEIKAKENANPDVEVMIRRCKYKDPETGACVVCWNESDEIWAKEFYHRFIEPLSPNHYLVSVDYHV
jgi:hypothetical protein